MDNETLDPEVKEPIDWSWVVKLSIPLLAIMSLYGIAHFNMLFFEPWVAWVTSAPFEVAIFGLALLRPKTKKQQSRALLIALVSAGVAVIYNFFSGLFTLFPDMMTSRPLWLNFMLAIIHAFSIPGLYLVINWFVLHQGEDRAAVSTGNGTSTVDMAKRITPSGETTVRMVREPRPRMSSSQPPQPRQLSLDADSSFLQCPTCQHTLMTTASYDSAIRDGGCPWCHPVKIGKRERREARAMRSRQG